MPNISRKYSVSLIESCILDLVIRLDTCDMYGPVSFLDDIDAERWVIRHLWNGEKPPDYLLAVDFMQPFHKWLFQYLKNAELTREEAITEDRMVSLAVLFTSGDKALENFTTMAERRRVIGPSRELCIHNIATVHERTQWMTFAAACLRVRNLAQRRRTLHRAQRLKILLEQATVDPKELWREHRGIGELLTELTGSDGKVDGW